MTTAASLPRLGLAALLLPAFSLAYAPARVPAVSFPLPLPASGAVELLERARALRADRARSGPPAAGGDLVSRILRSRGDAPAPVAPIAPATEDLISALFGPDGLDDADVGAAVARCALPFLLEAAGAEVDAADFLRDAARRRTRGEAPATAADYVAARRASEGEREAMRRTTAQLPRVVARPAAPRTATAAADPRRSEQEVLAGTGRVTAEEEQMLARLVRKGAALNAVKEELEGDLGRTPSRGEWAKAAGLSPPELRRSVSRYATAKQRLVTANLGLVHAVVKGGMGRKDGSRKPLTYRSVTTEELLQEGTLGLLRAAELFDPERGLKFSTYATIWIKGAIGNHRLDQFITLPTKWRSKAALIERCRRAVLAEDGRAPSAADLAHMTDLSEEQVRTISSKMRQATNVLSMDHTYSGKDASTTTLADSFVDDDAVAETVALRADLVHMLATALTEREARLLRLRYGLNEGGRGRSLTECAEAMGINYNKARNIAVAAVEKLRTAENVGALQEYLLTVA